MDVRTAITIQLKGLNMKDRSGLVTWCVNAACLAASQCDRCRRRTLLCGRREWPAGAETVSATVESSSRSS